MNNPFAPLLLATFSYLCSMFKGWNKDVILIILLGLFIRFLLMPYTQTVHADAISRILNANVWLSNPHYIIADVWGPLSTYLYAFSIKFLGGKIYGPKIINILFASFTAYPLYWFSRNVFKTRFGAVLVSSIYIITPIVIRNSFQALPAVTCAFFIATSMYHLSNYIKTHQLKYVVFAGIMITLAGALRYEAWVISSFFGIILLIHKRYVAFLIFGAVSALFPISWLIGNQIVYDNWFYCFQYSSEWTVNELQALSEVSQSKVIKRILFFPFSLMVVLSPMIFFSILIVIPFSALKKQLNKEQIVWLIPFLGLFSIYMYKALNGTLLLQHKYTITLALLILPFIALLLKQASKRMVLAVITSFVLIIPSQYIYNKIPIQKILPFSPKTISSIEEFLNNAYRETASVPQLINQKFELLVDESNNNLKPGDGVIVDFLGWENTYFYALNSNVHPLIISGSKATRVDFEQLNNYLMKHPNGLIMLNNFGELNIDINQKNTTAQLPNINVQLNLILIKKIDEIRLFRYSSTPIF